jgi:hypothetical protein
MDTATCADCGAVIALQDAKALDGTWATVWSSMEDWICPKTGDEHRPA